MNEPKELIRSIRDSLHKTRTLLTSVNSRDVPIAKILSTLNDANQTFEYLVSELEGKLELLDEIMEEEDNYE